jgi:hypothetical protein
MIQEIFENDPTKLHLHLAFITILLVHPLEDMISELLDGNFKTT